MKRVGLLVALSVFSLSNLISQNKFTISSGVAKPLGEFAATNYGDNSGYAKLGYSYGLQADYVFPSKILAGLSIVAHRNEFNHEAFMSDIVTDLGFKSTEIRSTGMHSSYTALAVGGYNIIDNPAFTLDASLGIGGSLSSMSTPVGIGARSVNLFNDEIDIDYNNKYAFAYNIGTRFIYYLSSSLGLSVSVSYFATNPEYITMKKVGSTSQKITSSRTYITNNSILDLTVGIVFGK